ncbi:very short patch repair endonuclease [Phyllobacterium sp. SB3]|uniref:very short patch repair endonuclease n=1 Tax=Phyllobacterium sp. SB3 TaxID=3156073 RepID=UPI0032AECFC6
MLFSEYILDRISPAKRSANMARIRSQNTRPEMTVRRLIHSLGYRYRLHVAQLPGRPDIVFSRKKAVIFINGCFWHQHGHPDCTKSSIPKTRHEFWNAKLQRNSERDAANYRKLDALGWTTLVIWECELNEEDSLVLKLTTFLRETK